MRWNWFITFWETEEQLLLYDLLTTIKYTCCSHLGLLPSEAGLGIMPLEIVSNSTYKHISINRIKFEDPIGAFYFSQK